MKRPDAYSILARELERWRALPERELIASVGQKPAVQVVRVEGEDLTIEVSAVWADAARARVCVTAVADGPSHWRLERLEEKITITLSHEEAHPAARANAGKRPS